MSLVVVQDTLLTGPGPVFLMTTFGAVRCSDHYRIHLRLHGAQ